MAPNERRRIYQLITPVFGFGLALLGGLGFGAVAVEPLLLRLSESNGPNPLQKVLAPVPSEVLLLGTDAEGFRTDVIASIHLTETGAHLTQIPRDTFIRSDDFGEQKVNALYAFGGLSAIHAGVEDLIGRPIEHHVVLNLDTLRKLGDALGGLEMTVEKRMRYRDRSQNLEIDLLPGHQHLRGRALEGYLRFRHDSEGDLGRMRRQRQAVGALMRQLATPEGMAKLPELLQIANSDIQTNLNLFQLAGMAKVLAGQELSGSALPGYLGYRNGISYWFVGDPDRQL